MHLLSLVSVVVALLAAVAPPPEERAPHPYVRASATGEYYFKMVPLEQGGGTCTAYQVAATGSDRELWAMSGWFSFRAQLCLDGQYLVQYGDPSRNEGALVAFYKGGKLVAQHPVSELIDDPSSQERVRCPLTYLSGEPPQFVGASSFRLTTDEGVECTFDYRTGELLSKVRK